MKQKPQREAKIFARSDNLNGKTKISTGSKNLNGKQKSLRREAKFPQREAKSNLIASLRDAKMSSTDRKISTGSEMSRESRIPT